MADAKFTISATDKTKAVMAGVEKRFKSLSKQAFSLRTAMAGVVAVLAVREFVKQEQAVLQLEARLKSTGGVAGYTSDQLQGMARSLQKVTTYGDDAVNEMQALLLTFTRIRGPEFAKSQEAILNVATAMNQDLQSAAIQVGKALNDPILGISALSRSGIQFTETQKETIKGMVAMNDIAGAQAVILQELETQFGGAARAAAQGFGGSIKQLQNASGDLLETLVSVATNGGKGGLVQWITKGVQAIDSGLQQARGVFYAFFAAIHKAIERVNYSWNVSAETVSWVFEKILGEIKIRFGAFVGAIGAVIEKIPGMSGIADSMKVYADEMIKAGASVVPLTERIDKHTAALARNLNAIDRNTRMLIDKETEKREALARLEQTTGADSRAKNVDLGESPELVKQRAQLQSKLDNVRQYLMDEETAEVEAWFRRQEIVDLNYQNKNLSDESYRRLTEDLEKKHLDNLTAIQSNALSDQHRLWTQGANGRLQVMSGLFGSISNLMQTESKKQFEVGKKAAIAQTTIDTYTAAMASYKALAGIPIVGPILGAAAAGAAIRYGKSQIDQIRAQQFGAGAGATGTFAANPNTGIPTGQNGEVNPSGDVASSQPERVFNISISGNPSRDQMRELIDTLDEELRDRGARFQMTDVA